MFSCPRCGRLLSPGRGDICFCENRKCTVVLVRNPSKPRDMRVVESSLEVKKSLNFGFLLVSLS
jgi:hypothetical protein